MVRRRAPQEPEIIVKEFSPQEVTRGIEKLQRRIADTEALKAGVRVGDERVRNVERSIRETVREVFGPQSPQFHDHEYHEVWKGPHIMGDPEHNRQAKFEAGILRTVTMLQGLIAWLEEKRGDSQASPVDRAKASLEGFDLHPRIAEASRDLYRDGHYEEAVFSAAKSLVNYVKEKSGKHELDGSNLMTTVFSKNNPILAFNDLKDDSDRDEQEGMMHLFFGAVLGIRNPRGHAGRDDSAQRALEHIVLLSLLANRVQETKRIGAPK